MFTLATLKDLPRFNRASWPGLAIEDRDLYAEANNEAGVASAWFEAICQMYPNKSIAN